VSSSAVLEQLCSIGSERFPAGVVGSHGGGLSGAVAPGD